MVIQESIQYKIEISHFAALSLAMRVFVFVFFLNLFDHSPSRILIFRDITICKTLSQLSFCRYFRLEIPKTHLYIL